MRPLLACLLVLAGCAATPRVAWEFKQPEGAGPFPAVVILHSCAGMGPHVRGWMGELAARGFASLAVDSFTNRGGGVCLQPVYVPATVEEMVDDAMAALEELRARPGIDGNRIAVVGFSYGAGAALRLASPWHRSGGPRFAAVVAFYPLCSDEHLRADIDTPTLILMGENDNDTPGMASGCVARVRALQRRVDKPLRIRLFAGLGHAFDLVDREARTRAATEMSEFLREVEKKNRR